MFVINITQINYIRFTFSIQGHLIDKKNIIEKKKYKQKQNQQLSFPLTQYRHLNCPSMRHHRHDLNIKIFEDKKKSDNRY